MGNALGHLSTNSPLIGGWGLNPGILACLACGPSVLYKHRAPKTVRCLNSGGMSEDRSGNVTVSAPAGHTVQGGILLVSGALEAWCQASPLHHSSYLRILSLASGSVLPHSRCLINSCSLSFGYQLYSFRHVWSCQVISVISDSLQPNGQLPARLLCPWDSPGKNTGVGCHTLLQGICSTQGPNLHLLCLLHWQVVCLTPAPPGKHFYSFRPLHVNGAHSYQQSWVMSL